MEMIKERAAPRVERLNEALGARMVGFDLSKPLSRSDIETILKAFAEHAVLVFHGQKLEPADLSRFTRHFGPLEVHHMAELPFPDFPEVRILSNVRKDGKLIGANRAGRHWHSDLSYLDETGLATFLYCVETPPAGGNTKFADMAAAYEALPKEMKRKVDGRTAIHDRNFRYSELYPDRKPLTPEQIAAVPPSEHPLVIQHPVTGRKALFVAKDVVSHIVGMEETESRALIDALEAFATQDRFVYSHPWQVGDLVVWDNRSTLHQATPYDEAEYRRIMYRTQCKGSVPIPAVA
ncbi:TauD/TfdA dioxygenase family protein [Afifella pfennigii]|uniref:TauD/TfdA dioxygenase family protein n=1 Tax=Afifella pfennigii TaxID=209897 RepID=UPI00068FE468|nr:TauD/TfdA family dioxygenase [Afifella pfennigii]